MHQERVTIIRCTCDHCGKRNWSPSHMSRHEKHCTMNPRRQCGFCGSARPLEVGVRIIRASGEGGAESGFFENVSDALLGSLRRWSGGCPGCMLAAVRQSGAELYLGYKQAKEEWFRAVDETELMGSHWTEEGALITKGAVWPYGASARS